MKEFLVQMRAGSIPRRFPECIGYGYGTRIKYIHMGMWALVDETWTKRLAGYIGDRKVLEIMAGVGWLAKALKAHGVNIVATDSGAWDKRHKKAPKIFDIKKMEASEAVDKIDADILLVSWPPYDDKTRSLILAVERWGTEKPVVYIGEGDGGCNASEEFFESFEQKEIIPMPSWGCIHDKCRVGYWRKK